MLPCRSWTRLGSKPWLWRATAWSLDVPCSKLTAIAHLLTVGAPSSATTCSVCRPLRSPRRRRATLRRLSIAWIMVPRSWGGLPGLSRARHRTGVRHLCCCALLRQGTGGRDRVASHDDRLDPVCAYGRSDVGSWVCLAPL